MSDNSDHPALDDYDIDDDYCDVDNDTPSTDIAAEQFSLPEDPNDTDPSFTHDTSMGNGSAEELDDIIDDEAIIVNDGRSVTRTTFYPWEIDDKDKQQWYSKLAKCNGGMWDSKRDTRNKKADNDRWIDGFCSVLESSDYVQSRVQHIIESINLKHMATYSAQQTILATIELVERNERIDRGGSPLTEDETFHDLLDAVGSDIEEMRKIRRLVREKSPLYEATRDDR